MSAHPGHHRTRHGIAADRQEPRSDAIRVLVAEDQALVRGAVAALLSLEPDLEVVAEIERGDQVVAAARASAADVALLDVEMPGVDGIAAANALHREVPSCRVLIVTTFGRPGYLRRAMESGRRLHGQGCARQAARRRDPSGARGAACGGPRAGRGIASCRRQPLSPREADVLREARDGSSVAEIAARLFLGDGTVRNYLSSAIGKTGSRNRVEAVHIAEQNGWL